MTDRNKAFSPVAKGARSTPGGDQVRFSLPDNIKEQIPQMASTTQRYREGGNNSSLGIRKKAGKRGQMAADDAVSVHLLKLEDLPDPLSMQEFRQHCLREGLPLQTKKDKRGSSEAFSYAKNIREKAIAESWNNTVSNLFGAYLSVYNLFKNWHSGLLQQRHVGPDVVNEHMASLKPRPPFLRDQKPGLSEKELNHLERQKKLVSLLIQYGIGINVEGGDASLNPSLRRHRNRTADQEGNRFASPMTTSKNRGQAVDQQFIREQIASGKLKPVTAQGVYPNLSNLAVPNSHSKPSMEVDADGTRHRRFSFAVSEDSRNGGHESQGHSSTGGHNSMLIEVDIAVRDNESDYRYPQDQYQVAKLATERMKAIHGQPKSIMAPNQHSQRSLGALRTMKTRGVDLLNTQEDLAVGKELTKEELNNNMEFFSPNHLRLKNEFLELKEKCAKLEADLEAQKARNQKILMQQIQEENNRSVTSKMLAMNKPDLTENLKSVIESKFYSAVDGLDPKIASVINSKMTEIKEYFFGQVRLISHHTETLQQDVAMMENINKQGVKLKELDPEHLIELIVKKEELKREQNEQLWKLDPSTKKRPEMNRPKCIWAMLDRHFGSDYFFEVIEEEYGIKPGSIDVFAEQIKTHFDHQILSYTHQQKQLTDEYEAKIDVLTAKNQELLEENIRLMRLDEKKLAAAIAEARSNAAMLFESEKQHKKKEFEAKLEQANETIRELTKPNVDGQRSLKQFQQNYAFKKWQMCMIIRSCIMNVDECHRTKIDKQMLKLVEKLILEKKLIRIYSQDHGVPPELAKEQMQVEKMFALKKKCKDFKIYYGHFSNKCDQLEAEISQCQNEIEKLHKENIELRQRLPALESANKYYEQALKMKEEENKELVDKVKIIENKWKQETKEPYKFTSKHILAALELKSFNEMSGHYIRQAKAISRTKHADKGTGTVLCNVEKVVEYRKMKEAKDVLDAEVQHVPLMDEIGVQATPDCYNKRVGKDRDFRLKTRDVGSDEPMPEGCNAFYFGGFYDRQPTGGKQQQQPQFEPSDNNTQSASTRDLQRQTYTTRQTRQQKKQGFAKNTSNSTVLDPKVFNFSNPGQRISQQSQIIKRHNASGGVVEETLSQQNSQHDSAGKMPKLQRRNTMHFKNSAHQQSQLSQERRTDSKGSNFRKTFVHGAGRQSDRSPSQGEQSSQVLKKGSTFDGSVQLLQQKLPAMEDKGHVKSSIVLPSKMVKQGSGGKHTLRQTVAGASVDSKHSSQNYQDFGKNLRKTHKVTQRDSDLGSTMNQNSTKNRLGQNQNLSTNKSPDKLNISQQQSAIQQVSKLHMRKTVTTSKDRLMQPLSKKGRGMSTRLTSAQAKNNPEQPVGLRSTLAKHKSKREILPSQNSLLANKPLSTTKKHKGGFTGNAKKADLTETHDMKGNTYRSNMTNSTINQNTRNNGQGAMSSRALQPSGQNKSQSSNGTKARIGDHNSGFSPDSQYQMNEDGEFTNLDSTRGRQAPHVIVKSFQEGAARVISSPLNVQIKNGNDFQMQQHTTEQRFNEDRLQSLDMGNSPQVQIEVEHPSSMLQIHDSNDRIQGSDSGNHLQLEGKMNAYDKLSHYRRPTTVKDTSKDYSQSSKPSALLAAVETSNPFGHLNVRDKTNSIEDICSTTSDPNAPSRLLGHSQLANLDKEQSSNRRHKKNFSSNIASGGINITNDLEGEGSASRTNQNKSFKLGGGKLFGTSTHNYGRSTESVTLNSRVQVGQKYTENKRLTNVREMDDEYPNLRESSSRVSEAHYVFGKHSDAKNKSHSAQRTKSNKSSFRSDEKSLVDFNQKNVVEMYKKATPSPTGKRSKQNKSKLSSSLEKSQERDDPDGIVRIHRIARVNGSFESDDDTSEYTRTHRGTGKYSRRETAQFNIEQAPSPTRQSQDEQQFGGLPMGSTEPLEEVERQMDKVQNDPLLTKRTKIQKLLLKGYINEEQFICLQLLEKGYIPSSPGEVGQQASYRTSALRSRETNQQQSQGDFSPKSRIQTAPNNNMYMTQGPTGHNYAADGTNGRPMSLDTNTATSGFYSRPSRSRQIVSCSASHSRSPKSKGTSNARRVSKGFIENTYRIYPNKIPVLEKIFNRVYAKKKTVGVQTQVDESMSASDVPSQQPLNQDFDQKMLGNNQGQTWLTQERAVKQLEHQHYQTTQQQPVNTLHQKLRKANNQLGSNSTKMGTGLYSQGSSARHLVASQGKVDGSRKPSTSRKHSKHAGYRSTSTLQQIVAQQQFEAIGQNALPTIHSQTRVMRSGGQTMGGGGTPNTNMLRSQEMLLPNKDSARQRMIKSIANESQSDILQAAHKGQHFLQQALMASAKPKPQKTIKIKKGNQTRMMQSLAVESANALKSTLQARQVSGQTTSMTIRSKHNHTNAHHPQRQSNLYSPPEQISSIEAGGMRTHNLILPVHGHSATLSQHVTSGRRTAQSGVASPEMAVHVGESNSAALLSRERHPKS